MSSINASSSSGGGIGFFVKAILQNSTELEQLLNTLKEGIDLNINTENALNNIRTVKEAVDNLKVSMESINLGNYNSTVTPNNMRSGSINEFSNNIREQVNLIRDAERGYAILDNLLRSNAGAPNSGNGNNGFDYSNINGEIRGVITGLRVTYDETNQWTRAVLSTLDGYKKISYELENINGQPEVTNSRTEDTKVQQAINDRLYYQKDLIREISNLENKRLDSNGKLDTFYSERIEYLKEQLKILEQNINSENILSQKQQLDLQILKDKNAFRQQEKEIISNQASDIQRVSNLYNEQKQLMKERAKLEVELVTTAEQLKSIKQDEINSLSQKINSNSQELNQSNLLNQSQKETLRNLEKHEEYLINIANQARQIRENSKYGQTVSSGSSVADLQGSSWWLNNVKGTSEIVKQTASTIDNLGNSISKTTIRVKTDENQWKSYNFVIDETNKKIHLLSENTTDIVNHQQQLSNMLISAIERFVLWGISMKMWTGITDNVKECITYIKQLDEAMNNIQRITMGTKEEMQGLADTYNQLAIKLKTSTLDVAKGAQTWLRQGFSLSDTNTLVEDSMVLSKLALIDAGDATQYLTSTLKGYQLQSEEVIGVIDKMVAIDFKAATTAQDVAEALSRCANMARTSGVDINQTMSMIATVLEVTQKSASTVGEAFKTMFSRMSNVKAGELFDPESAESLNDVETSLMSLGIKLRDNKSEFRNFGDVLDEIASKWQSFSDVQRAAVSSAIGGTRQRENVVALFENYSKVKELEKTTYESSGTAMEKYSIYQESVAAKQQELNARFEQFYSILLNSGVVSFFYDLGNVIMNFMTALDGTSGKIILITAAFTAFYLLLNNSRTTTLIKTIGKSLASIPSAIKGIVDSIKSLTMAERLQSSETEKNILSQRELVAEECKRIATEEAINKELATQNTLAAANPYLAIITAVLMVGTLISGIMSELNKKQQEAIDNAKELMDTYTSDTSSITSNINSLESVKNEYKKLSEGVDEYGNNISLSADQYQRYQEIVATVLGYSPSLITGYNKEGKAIANKNNLIEQSIALLQQENKAKLENMVTDDNLKIAFEGSVAQIKEVNSELSKIKSPDYLNNDTYDRASINVRRMLKDFTNIDLGVNENINQYISNNFDSIIKNIDSFKSKYKEAVKDFYLYNDPQIPTSKLNSITEEAEKSIDVYIQSISQARKKISDAEKTFNPTLQLVAQTTQGYNEISNAGKNIITNFVNGIEIGIKSDRKKIQSEVSDLVSLISNEAYSYTDSNGNILNTSQLFDKLFSLDKSKLSVIEYQKQYKEIVDAIFNNNAITQYASKYQLSIDDIKVKMGIKDVEIDTQKVENVAERAVQQIYRNIENSSSKHANEVSVGEDILKERIEKLQGFLGNLNVGEFETFNEMVNSNNVDFDTISSFDDLTNAIENYKSSIAEVPSMKENIDELKELSGAYDSLYNIVTEYNNNGFVTIKTLESLLSLDAEYLSLLSLQNGQLVLNEQAMREMLTVKMQNTQITLLDNVLTAANAEEKANTTSATDDLTSSTESQSSILDAHTQSIKNNNAALSERFDRLNDLQGFSVNQDGMVEYKGESKAVKTATAAYNNYKTLMDNVLKTSSNSLNRVLSSSVGSKKSSSSKSSTGRTTKDNTASQALSDLKNKVSALERPCDVVDKKLRALGNVNTIEEKSKQSELLAQKFRLISSNLSTVKNMLSSKTLNKEMREYLEDKMYSYMAELVAIKDKIESNVREAFNLEKKNALLKSELEYKEKLYKVEKELYGEKGKDLWEHEQNERIRYLQSIIDAREKEKETKEAINKDEEYQNKLMEARLKLQNALNNKTTKILTQQEDGSWQFEYSFNPETVKTAQEELREIEKDYSDWQYDKETRRYQSEIDALKREMEEKSSVYEDSEFHLKQSLDAQKNAIEKYYVDIEQLTIDYMSKLESQYGGAWDRVIATVQDKLDRLDKLNKELSGRSQYEYSSVGFNNRYTGNFDSPNPVRFDSGGDANNSGLAYLDKKERVLSSQQTFLFEKLVGYMPRLLEMFDVTKFNYKQRNSPNAYNSSEKRGMVINKVECVFPNVKSPDGIQKAILDLPRLALQTK